MPIITKPYSTASKSDFSWENFVRDCINGNYILVVGNEAILNKNENIEAEGNSNKLLFGLILDYLKNKNLISQQGLPNFSQLCHHFNDVRNSVLDVLDYCDFKTPFEKEFEPTLLKLLSTKCFRIVLTTTIDPYLEIAMERVWGKGGFRTLSIFDTKNDLARSELRSGEFNEMKPTLYYVFGKADTANRQRRFVLSENDAMATVARWFGDKRPKELLNYITSEGMKLLSIGCRFDDWLFRFFWYVMRGDISKLSAGQVAVELDDSSDRKLKDYLTQQHIKVFDNARTFMSDATGHLQGSTDIKLLQRKLGGVFISYAHDDAYIALPLFNRLTNAGFNVWIDECLNPGDDYNKRIATAINDCKVFMPILSSQVKEDLTNCVERYYFQEWDVAQKRYEQLVKIGKEAEMKVLPIVVGQYQVNSVYHKCTPSCINSKTVFEVSKDTTENLIRVLTSMI